MEEEENKQEKEEEEQEEEEEDTKSSAMASSLISDGIWWGCSPFQKRRDQMEGDFKEEINGVRPWVYSKFCSKKRVSQWKIKMNNAAGRK